MRRDRERLSLFLLGGSAATRKEEKMLYVKVPKEIKEYEEKLLFGLTLRNLIWGGLAIITGLVSYFPLRYLLGQEVASYLIMLIVVPLFACGFLKVQGMTFDKYLRLMIDYHFRKQILVYENFAGWIETFERKENDDVSKKERKRRKKETRKLQENQDD